MTAFDELYESTQRKQRVRLTFDTGDVITAIPYKRYKEYTHADPSEGYVPAVILSDPIREKGNTYFSLHPKYDIVVFKNDPLVKVEYVK